MIVIAETASRYFVSETQIDNFQNEYGVQAVRRLNSLLVLMEDLTQSPEDKIIISVNRFFNQPEYRPDTG